MPAKTQATLLNGVTSTGAGTGVDALEYNCFAFYINASSVTTGGTVKIQTLSPAGDWVDLSETAVTADGDTLVTKDGAFLQVRANVTARTDGTYTVTMEAKEGRINEAATSAESVVSTTDLVSFWKLDEASGTRADSHGSNSLTDNNTVGQGTGTVYANAADFESSNSEYFNIPDASAGDFEFGGHSPFTISCWAKFESAPSVNNLGAIVSKYDPYGDNREYILAWSDFTKDLVFQVSATGTSNVAVSASTFGTPSTGVWYHIIAYHDPDADEIGIAVNGGAVDTTAHSSGLLTGGAADFLIGGAESISSHVFPMDGLIEAVGIWNRVLTSAEMTALANKDDPFYDQF